MYLRSPKLRRREARILRVEAALVGFLLTPLFAALAGASFGIGRTPEALGLLVLAGFAFGCFASIWDTADEVDPTTLSRRQRAAKRLELPRR